MHRIKGLKHARTSRGSLSLLEKVYRVVHSLSCSTGLHTDIRWARLLGSGVRDPRHTLLCICCTPHMSACQASHHTALHSMRRVAYTLMQAERLLNSNPRICAYADLAVCGVRFRCSVHKRITHHGVEFHRAVPRLAVQQEALEDCGQGQGRMSDALCTYANPQATCGLSLDGACPAAGCV